MLILIIAPKKCSICSKTISDDCKKCFCNFCFSWQHMKCNYGELKDFYYEHETDFRCNNCYINVLPFCNNIESAENMNMDYKQNIEVNPKRVDEEGTPLNKSIKCKYYDVDEISKIFTSDKFSILHINIASMSRHFDELCTLLDKTKSKFKIIGISETRFCAQPILNFSIPDYNVEFTPTESSCGGTLLYISKTETYICRNDLNQLLYSPKLLEATFVELKYSSSTNVIVGCIYRHPCMSLDEFNTKFFSPLLERISRENKVLTLMGDFNIDLLQCESDRNTERFVDIISSYLLIPAITLPTRVTNSSSTLIDNILISQRNFEIKSGNIICGISDHFAQFLVIEKYVSSSNNFADVYRRNWSKFDQKDFIKDFENINWEHVLAINSGNVNLSFEKFYSTVDKLIDKHLPLTKLSKNKKRHQLKPWISTGLRKSIRKRDKFLSLYIRAKDPENKMKHHENYKRYRNQIVSLCKQSKRMYFTKYFQQNIHNIRNIWKGVKQIIDIKAAKNLGTISLEINNGISSDSEVISESLIHIFVP